MNKKVFFFRQSPADKRLELVIIKQTVLDKSTAQFEQESAVFDPVKIKHNSDLESWLKMKLRRPGKKELPKGFNFPEPTLVEIGDVSYLVVTELFKGLPRLCFYDVSGQKSGRLPALIIERAELLIECDSAHSTLRFLTNAALLESSLSPDADPSLARLQSQSYVVEISHAELVDLQGKSGEEAGL